MRQLVLNYNIHVIYPHSHTTHVSSPSMEVSLNFNIQWIHVYNFSKSENYERYNIAQLFTCLTTENFYRIVNRDILINLLKPLLNISHTNTSLNIWHKLYLIQNDFALHTRSYTRIKSLLIWPPLSIKR